MAWSSDFTFSLRQPNWKPRPYAAAFKLIHRQRRKFWKARPLPCCTIDTALDIPTANCRMAASQATHHSTSVSDCCWQALLHPHWLNKHTQCDQSNFNHNMDSVKNFFQNEKAHTFNFVFASILFFGFGVPTVSQYGYSTNVYQDALDRQADDGSLRSGRFGQGVFPMTLMLWIVAAFLFFSTLLSDYVCKKQVDEKDE